MRTGPCQVLGLAVMSLAVACGQGKEATDGGPLGGAIALGIQAGAASSTLVGYFGSFDAGDVPADPCAGSEYNHCCLLPQGTGMALSSPLVFPSLLSLMSVGPLTITDRTTDGGVGVAQPSLGATGSFYSADALAAWAAGDTLVVEADGGAFPSFSGSIQSPPALVALEPAIIPGASGVNVITIPTSADFAISWTPDSTSDQILATLGGETSTLVQCSGQASDGSIIFPTALLVSQLDTHGTLSLVRTRWTHLSSPTSTVALGAAVAIATNVAFQ